MKIHRIIAAAILMFSAAAVFAADYLAIAKPVAKGLSENEIASFWNMLETSADGDFKIISRSAVNQMLTEINMADSSGLIDMNSTQRANIGKIKGVKYILVSQIGKSGNRITVSLMILDASTGEILPDSKISDTVTGGMDELSDRLKDMLDEINLGTPLKKRGISALLAPSLKIANAPDYLGIDFNSLLEETLLDKGIKLQNLQSVDTILRKNNIGKLNEIQPAMYRRIGELLRVDMLIQATITRFNCIQKKEYISVTRKESVRTIGNFDGTVKIISARNGNIIASIPFSTKVDFDDLDDTEDWEAADFGKYLIKQAAPKIASKIIAKMKN